MLWSKAIGAGGAGGATAPLFGPRGVFGGGRTAGSGSGNVLDYIPISTTGNATDFGDLTTAASDGTAATSDGSRGVFSGSSSFNRVDYITISTTGNASTFGALSVARFRAAATSDGSRGVFGGGLLTSDFFTSSNVVDYITIATTGDATDLGNLTAARNSFSATSNGPRGVFGGGYIYSPYTIYNTIDYITIATLSNAFDFGDLSSGRHELAATSDGSRGVFGGGNSNINIMEYITIATLSNTTDFGDLTIARIFLAATSDGSRGVFGGGYFSASGSSIAVDTIDYIPISTTGNATDFGDLTLARWGLAATSGG